MYVHKSEFEKLMKDVLLYVRDIFYAGASRTLALPFDFTLGYIANILSLSNSRLGDFIDRIYPNDFEIQLH
jgi:hypothetical protein